MAKFSYYHDKRGKKNKPKDYKYAVCICANINGETIYVRIPGALITTSQYTSVFVKKSCDIKSIEFRTRCSSYLVKAEKIYQSLGRSCTRSEFVKLYRHEGDFIPKSSFNSLILEDIVKHYIENNTTSSQSYITHVRTSLNVLNRYQLNLSLTDVTPEFLENFRRYKDSCGCSPATIQSYIRDLRMIINYAISKLKVVPDSYIYPFGRNGFTIGNYFPNKSVMTHEEIKKVVELNEFESKEQEFARDIWLFLYRCNGINFADLLDMKWDNINGTDIVFQRRKTKKTRKNNIKFIVAPITNGVSELLEKIGDKTSIFILGKLEDGYTEKTFFNKCDYLRRSLNSHLKTISAKLNLSVDLITDTARDCYATTLFRSGVPVKDINEMLGHANVIVTEHYLGAFDKTRAKDINKYIL